MFELTGHDGNAFGIMGRVMRALRKEGVNQEGIDAYLKEAKSGDYDNLLAVTTAVLDEHEIEWS